MTRLRLIERRDLETLRLWRNDPKLSRVFRRCWPISEQAQEDWFAAVSQYQSPHLMFVVEEDGRVVGAAGLTYIDWVHRLAELSLNLGPEHSDAVGPAAFNLLKEWAFTRLGLHKLWVELYDLDDWRIKTFQDLGMKIAGRFTNHRWVNGRWVDSLLLEMTNAG